MKDANKHPATRTFQAIRIFINRELDEIQKTLEDSIDILASGGRLVVISFHSLEDRLVKRFMRDKATGPKIPRGVPVMASRTESPLRLVGSARKPSTKEISANPRARSAIMRVAERTDWMGAH